MKIEHEEAMHYAAEAVTMIPEAIEPQEGESIATYPNGCPILDDDNG